MILATNVASAATSLGVCVAAVGVLLTLRQLRFNETQAQASFEDGLTASYRRIVAELPIGALLNETLAPDEAASARSAFYRYFDLCNEQVFLRDNHRLSDETWDQWRDGIAGNLARVAFKAAWREMETGIGDDFTELRREFRIELAEPPS